MTELTGLLWLLAGLGALSVSGGLLACCLRLESILDVVLASYVIGWAWLVGTTLVLSPPHLVTRGWLLSALLGESLLVFVVWRRSGAPPAPRIGPAVAAAREALRAASVLVFGAAVALGFVYSAALALFTPANEGDALAYHLARAAFWRQEHAVGYIANATDLRLNVSPPNAEIGQLATMLLSGGDRYVALTQLFSYPALALCVAALARRFGYGPVEALFAALAFATLPVVLVQTSGALNDLVVASFLAAATAFALRPQRSSLLLIALAIGLAVGAKVTALFALPALALVVGFGNGRRRLGATAMAGASGLALGSVWYLLNLVRTGDLDGGLAQEADQRVAVSVGPIVANGMRYLLDLVDMSGAVPPWEVAFVVAAVLVTATGLIRALTSGGWGKPYLAASVIAMVTLLTSLVAKGGQSAAAHAWNLLGKPDTPGYPGDVEGAGLNVLADPVHSWYGPLGVLILVAGTAVAVKATTNSRSRRMALTAALAPLVLLLTLAVTVAWDPFRGRFLIVAFAIATAASAPLWRSETLRYATVAIGSTTLALTLVNYEGKQMGLGNLWGKRFDGVPRKSIWIASRTDAQTRLRPGTGEAKVIRFVSSRVPETASLALAPRDNDFLSPYFGPRLSRRVSLVSRRGGDVPGDADWLVLSPHAHAMRCRKDWRTELSLRAGWRVEHRLDRSGC